MRLTNNDFLEVAEYFVVEANSARVIRYRFQWVDETQQMLKRRWDNAKHFPDLPGFPHHIHVGSEDHVVTGKALNTVESIDQFEKEFSSTG